MKDHQAYLDVFLKCPSVPNGLTNISITSSRLTMTHTMFTNTKRKNKSAKRLQSYLTGKNIGRNISGGCAQSFASLDVQLFDRTL